MLASGWGFCSWLRASGTSWIFNGLGVQTVLIPFVVLGGIWLAAVGILVKSLKVTSRNDILSAAVVPCLVVGAFLVFIGVPALELVQGTGGRGFALVDDLWRQIGGVILLAVIVVALYGPQQFFWRDAPRLRRVALLVLLAGLPTFVILPLHLSDPFPAVLRSYVGGIVLVGLAAWIVEVTRTAMETDSGLRSGAVGAIEPKPTLPYSRNDTPVRLVGVALSGGGYRASLFALGALMYLHDACAQPGTRQRRIAAITSVSGGSVTNAALGHGMSLDEDGRDKIDYVAKTLVRHTVREGSMFAGWAVLYYLLLLPVAGLGFLALAWLAFDHVTWAVLWRSALIPVITGLVVLGAVELLVAVDRIELPYLQPILTAVSVIVVLGGIGVWLQIVLSRPDWRLALSWIATGVLVIGAAAMVWTLRGTLIQHTFQRLLDRLATRSSLADIRTRPHHIFCATEVQFDETAYFAGDAIQARSFSSAAPGNIPTAMAVRASAAFPGAFPPVIVRGITGKKEEGTGHRDAPRSFHTEHMVLVDGGVRDNLGVDWFTGRPGMVDELLVVSAAANRRPPRAITQFPGISEMRALLNLTSIPYNTRERNRRRALTPLLFSGSGSAGTGALCHIEDSPFDLARDIQRWSKQWASQLHVGDAISVPDWELDQLLTLEQLQRRVTDSERLAERATAVIDHLEEVEETLPDPPGITQRDDLEIRVGIIRKGRLLHGGPGSGTDAERAWWKRTQLNAVVPTKLSRIPAPTAMNLLIHGYYLAMANLSVLLGWPMLKDLDSARLEDNICRSRASPDQRPSE